MKNKIKGYIYLCIALSVSFFNRLFVSITHAQDMDSTTYDSIPLAGILPAPPPSPSPEEIARSIGAAILIVILPITLIVLITIFIKKKFFNKSQSKKKKKV
jgi:hypothetical protein